MSSRTTFLPLSPAQEGRSSRALSLVRFATLALLGSLAIAVAAHVSIPVPFTVVPFTLQPLAVLLVGLLFGPSLGFATLCLYLAEGAAGLPVFQPFGLGGLLQLMGPTAGFLLAYPVVALIAGGLYRSLRTRSRYLAAAVACTVATLFLFTAGAAWFAILTHAGLRTTLFSTVLPFLPGEAVKVLAAAGIASAWANRASR